MAAPRVFISSTCYDLADERDLLASFCDGFGFGCALSERGDVFFHPDFHTHESCVHEISTCQLFVLIIGGRFGGRYVSDKARSITNAEYSAAKESGIPIFTFVKQDVLNDHNIWQRNKSSDFAQRIEYPSIDKQEHAVDIFTFIDQVRLSPSNNGFFGFRFTREILDFLRKQWSSMLFEFLQSRTLAKQLATTNANIASLSAASAKIEEIVRNIYKNVDAVGAVTSLSEIDLEGSAKAFFATLAAKTLDREMLFARLKEAIVNEPNSVWYKFLDDNGFFDIQTNPAEDGSVVTVLRYMVSERAVFKLSGELNKLEQAEVSFLADCYASYLKLTPESRAKIVTSYLYNAPPPPKKKATASDDIPF